MTDKVERPEKTSKYNILKYFVNGSVIWLILLSFVILGQITLALANREFTVECVMKNELKLLCQ
jgi:hypothetical protein